MKSNNCEMCPNKAAHRCSVCGRSVCHIHLIFYITKDGRIIKACVVCGRKMEQYEKSKASVDGPMQIRGVKESLKGTANKPSPTL